jgi:hypothetical protein
VRVNRTPVLTVWAAVVAEVLGFEHDEAPTLGQAGAGLNSYSKGVVLGFFQPTPTEVKEQRRKMRKEETVTVDLLQRAVPAKHTDKGLRALSGESPIRAESVEKYLEGKFGDALEDVSKAMLDSLSLYHPFKYQKEPTACMRNSGLRFPRAKRGWGAPTNWTWTSSAKRLSPEEPLFNSLNIGQKRG